MRCNVTEKKKHTYQSDMLGLPPLKMVLVHAENDRRNAALKAIQKPNVSLQKAGIGQEDLIRLIEYLKKKA
jgi:hypothetical protein